MSKIAFRSSSSIVSVMKIPVLICASLLSVYGSLDLMAQSQDGPPPPPPEKMDKGPGDPSKRGGGPGNPGGPGGPPGMDRGGRDRGDIFKNLSDADKKRVREAFDKVWNEPEVIAAREQFQKANDEYRNTVHEALKRLDPGVVEILDRNKPPGGGPPNFFGGPGGPGGDRRGPELPSADDPEFVSKVMARLSPYRHHRGEWDDKMKEAHQRIMSVPEVADALTKLKEAAPQDRPEAWRKLEWNYRRNADGMDRPREGGPEPRPEPGPSPEPSPKQ